MNLLKEPLPPVDVEDVAHALVALATTLATILPPPACETWANKLLTFALAEADSGRTTAAPLIRTLAHQIRAIAALPTQHRPRPAQE